MTEREVLDIQEQNGNQEYLLILIGSFLHAYGNGAFALARATGYRVFRKQRKWGKMLTCGFPVGKLDDVRQRLLEKGGELVSLNDKTWTFRGIDGTPDEQMVSEPQPKALQSPEGRAQGLGAEVIVAIRGFNLSMSTPMDAMLFIGTLQQRLKENDDACESPPGQGLAE